MYSIFEVIEIVGKQTKLKNNMYNISYFKEEKKEVILDFMEENPFIFLTGRDISGNQVVTQIPVLIEDRNGELFLQGHIMRHTDHHKAFIQNPNVLAVFTGASAYVSASWYNNTQNGSTWNYMSVYVYGKINFMTDDKLRQFMQKMTLKFEQGDTTSPTIYDNLPQEYIDKMMPAIVGFEIKAEKIENVFKLSQNKDKESYERIISKLNEKGGNSSLIASEMEKRKKQLFF